MLRLTIVLNQTEGLLLGFASVVFCWVASLVKKKKERERSLTGKHSHEHTEKRSMLNSIKALKKSIINLFQLRLLVISEKHLAFKS